MVSLIVPVVFEKNIRTESRRKGIGLGVHQTWIPFTCYIIFDP